MEKAFGRAWPLIASLEERRLFPASVIVVKPRRPGGKGKVVLTWVGASKVQNLDVLLRKLDQLRRRLAGDHGVKLVILARNFRTDPVSRNVFSVAASGVPIPDSGRSDYHPLESVNLSFSKVLGASNLSKLQTRLENRGSSVRKQYYFELLPNVREHVVDSLFPESGKPGATKRPRLSESSLRAKIVSLGINPQSGVMLTEAQIAEFIRMFPESRPAKILSNRNNARFAWYSFRKQSG